MSVSEWIVTIATLALVNAWMLFRSWPHVRDNWRNFETYPIKHQFVTPHGVSGSSTTTYFNKGARGYHTLDASTFGILLNPVIVLFSALVFVPSAFIVGIPMLLVFGAIPYLLVVEAMKLCSQEAYEAWAMHWIFPIGLGLFFALVYWWSVERVRLGRMEDQARRECATGVVVSPRKGLGDLFFEGSFPRLSVWLKRRRPE